MERPRDAVGLGPIALGQLVHDVRPGPPRRYRVDADAVGREVHRLVAGQLQDRGLADGIDPTPGLRHTRGNRAEIDDRAPGLGEVRTRGLHQDHRADEIDVEGGEPVGAGRLGAVVEIGAGDVDEKIEPPRGLDGLFDQRLNIPVARDVGADETRLRSDASSRRGAVGLVDVGDHDIDAVADQRFRHRLADHRRPADDDRGFVG
jgi:hypothetical protein